VEVEADYHHHMGDHPNHRLMEVDLPYHLLHLEEVEEDPVQLQREEEAPLYQEEAVHASDWLVMLFQQMKKMKVKKKRKKRKLKKKEKDQEEEQRLYSCLVT